MKVYVLTWEPDHANSDVRAVAVSLHAAQAAAERAHGSPLEWEHDTHGTYEWWRSKPTGGRGDVEGYEITPHGVIQE